MVVNADSIKWEINTFNSLSIDSLYRILRLRCETFALEQNVVYQDMDNEDQKAMHLQGFIGDELVAYCRLFRAGDHYEEASIGRVIIYKPYRKIGYGHILVDKAINIINKLFDQYSITISAQQHLKLFYEEHGFIQTSEMYIEEGIPHIQMKKHST